MRAIARNWWLAIWTPKSALLMRRIQNIPIKLSQITPINLTIAKIASPIHSAGVRYRLSQKKRLSVALIVRLPGSEDSKTQ